MQAKLIDSMGSDLTVVNSARVSFNKHKEEFEDKDQRLIKYLANHGHFTPFTHPQITIREKVPIFVARQRFKHTVGFSYNEVSRRYVDNIPEFYMPENWRNRPEGSVKQGSGGVYRGEEPFGNFCNLPVGYVDFINIAKDLYLDMIHKGIAPEQARMILPQSMYTEYYVTGSLYAWARAYRLRIDSDSQQEIQELAKEWDNIIKDLYPISWKALIGE